MENHMENEMETAVYRAKNAGLKARYIAPI